MSNLLETTKYVYDVCQKQCARRGDVKGALSFREEDAIDLAKLCERNNGRER